MILYYTYLKLSTDLNTGVRKNVLIDDDNVFRNQSNHALVANLYSMTVVKILYFIYCPRND